MLSNFLSKSKPINFIVIFGLFFFVFVAFTVHSFLNYQFNLNTCLKSVGFLTLFSVLFFFFNFIISKNQLTFDNSYAYFIFTILSCYFFEILFDYENLILYTIQIFFLRKIYSLKSSKNTLQKLFDAGLWMGILFILQPFTIIFSVLIYAAIIFFKKLNLNNLFIPIIGFITPLLLFFTHAFWFDETYLFTNLFYFSNLKSIGFYNEGISFWLTLVLLFFTLLGIVLKSPKALSINNSFKRNWQVLIVNIGIAIIFALLTPKKNGSELLFLLFPASVIIGNGIEVIQKTLLKNILFLLFLISCFIVPFIF